MPGKFPMGSTPSAGMSEHSCVVFKPLFDEFKSKGPAFCVYGMAKPILIPTDPDLVKDIFVKHFDMFHERGIKISEEADPLSQHLSFKNGQEWKDLRAKLSPSFTTGRMKMMFPNIVKSCDRMIDYLKPFAERVEPLEMKDVYCSFTTEVIADVAFGLEINCMGNAESEFKKIAKRIFEPTPMEIFKLTVLFSFEKLGEMLKFGFNGKEVTEFIMKIVRDTKDYREKNNVQRNDFFQFLLNIQKTEGLSFNELAANSFIFFLAG